MLGDDLNYVCTEGQLQIGSIASQLLTQHQSLEAGQMQSLAAGGTHCQSKELVEHVKFEVVGLML